MTEDESPSVLGGRLGGSVALEGDDGAGIEGDVAAALGRLT
jgi:hypothetical protein